MFSVSVVANHCDTKRHIKHASSPYHATLREAQGSRIIAHGSLIFTEIALGGHMHQPNRGDPADGQALPVAILMEVLVEQAGHIHADQVRERQRNTVHTITSDGQVFSHSQSYREPTRIR